MCAGAPPSRRLDPRVAGVLASIRASDDLRISLEDAAASVFLSPGRFAHLFTAHVGLPFRRYMLWRKLSRAMVAIGRSDSLAQAAYAGGFADAAHLTRTFNQMFGLPPSTLMRGEFFEIAPPFQLEASGRGAGAPRG
jgi:AraC-like DNA-binding protein